MKLRGRFKIRLFSQYICKERYVLKTRKKKNKSPFRILFEAQLFNIFVMLPLNILNLIQRMPFVLLVLLSSSIALLLYKITRKNIIMMVYLRFSIRCYFLLNGIWLSIDPKIKELGPNIFITNYAVPIDFLVHYLTLTLRKIIILPNIYFNLPKSRAKSCFYFYLLDALASLFKENYRTLYYISGFLPREEFTIEDFKKKDFFIEQYLENDFSVLETANFEYEPYKQIPFSLMLAIKHQKPAYVLEMAGSENAIYASILFPRLIKVRLKGVVEPNPDIKVMVDDYYSILNR